MSIQVEKSNLIYSPLWYHKRGLMQTATGYGRKLTTRWKMRYAGGKDTSRKGRLYRIYYCIFSNCGTYYIVRNGEEINVEIND